MMVKMKMMMTMMKKMMMMKMKKMEKITRNDIILDREKPQFTTRLHWKVRASPLTPRPGDDVIIFFMSLFCVILMAVVLTYPKCARSQFFQRVKF